MRRWQQGILGLTLWVTTLLVAALAGLGGGAAPEGALAIPLEGRISGKLNHFADAVAEGSCASARGAAAGHEAGTAEVGYDGGRRALLYRLALSGAAPDTQYLVDVTECGPGGERRARGDGGHVRTDGRGQAALDATWMLRTEARWVEITLVPFCDGDGGIPIIPCGAGGLATDALELPGR